MGDGPLRGASVADKTSSPARSWRWSSPRHPRTRTSHGASSSAHRSSSQTSARRTSPATPRPSSTSPTRAPRHRRCPSTRARDRACCCGVERALGRHVGLQLSAHYGASRTLGRAGPVRPQHAVHVPSAAFVRPGRGEPAALRGAARGRRPVEDAGRCPRPRGLDGPRCSRPPRRLRGPRLALDEGARREPRVHGVLHGRPLDVLLPRTTSSRSSSRRARWASTREGSPRWTSAAA